MDVNTIVSSGAALTGVIAGYFIKSFFTRLKNICYVTGIESVTKRDDYVEINQNSVDKARDSVFFRDLKSLVALKKLHAMIVNGENIRERWPMVSKKIEEFKANPTSPNAIELVEQIMNFTVIDKWLMLFLIQNKCDDLKVDKLAAPPIIINPIDPDGDIYIEFPNKNIAFSVPNSPTVIGKANILLNNIANKNIENLIVLFGRFSEFLESEYRIANSIFDTIKRVYDENSRWMFNIQFVNISGSTILLLNEAKAFICGDKIKYPIDLYSARLYQENEIAEQIRYDSNQPIVIKSGENIKFIFVSKEIEKNQIYGQSIRNLFEKKIGKIFLKIEIVRPGFIQRKSINTKSQKINTMNFLA